MVGVCVGLEQLLHAVGALRDARHGEGSVLLAPNVVDCLLRALPADEVTFNDLDVRAHHSAVVGLLPIEAGEPYTLTCSYTERVGRLRGEVLTTGEFYSGRKWHSTGVYIDHIASNRADEALVMPLPAPPGIARQLVFFREPGCPFGDAERDAAVLLQPHIADALRLQGRRAASRLLTGRQYELLRLVAVGQDNIAIARQLGISPTTIRKHLENTFARLGVSSRTAAVARLFPDAIWQ
jgi:DNA-binding CsgD family transcriptional regulator